MFLYSVEWALEHCIVLYQPDCGTES